MLVKVSKIILCMITATFALNAQAVFMAEVDETSYEWLELTNPKAISHIHVEEKLTGESAALYEYKYSSRELEQDISRSYAPFYGATEWRSGDSTVNTASVDTSDGSNKNSSPSVKVLLLIISGLIGVFGITKDRSHL